MLMMQCDDSLNRAQGRFGKSILHARSAEKTKTDLVDLIDESWRKVRGLVDPECLPLCESELRGATSLLVLATLRKAADEYSSSRLVLEWMLRSADANGDG
eukprot:gene52848-64572_t